MATFRCALRALRVACDSPLTCVVSVARVTPRVCASSAAFAADAPRLILPVLQSRSFGSSPAVLGSWAASAQDSAQYAAAWAIARSWSSSAAAVSSTAQESKAGGGENENALAESAFDSLTDKIPERPVSAAEASSYSVVILAGLAVAAAAAYAFASELLITPKEYRVFDAAMERLRNDPRVAVRLGNSLSGYGSDSKNRSARQRIPHRSYTSQEDGREHMRVQFYVRGSSGVGVAHADAYNNAGTWVLHYLFLDVNNVRVTLVNNG
ncbi:hypothetical protein PPROV_000343400 [Pycnococcus provasolii]|uniref:Mitochondrial import inner membrane translocase subunit Tim21 n=2 Tax=Pycnococcus provasolii TaxID=41880 RepID=A0A830HGB6_9CHLO|nr:hypothetical protein PPROV_000343400 [Pycnococcus provasolii]